uniref:Protein zer-1 homolog-like C-terminal domain-containing protein n=1 Tax=Romanomermis culicivorax TaxID=13658 RepID=A0A915KQJ6_ROMCU
MSIIKIFQFLAAFQKCFTIFRSFIEARPRLEFCGLLMSNACYFDCVLSKTELRVCGEAEKKQVFCALETYWSRDYFCSKTMYLLFRLLEMEFGSFSVKEKYFCVQYIVKGLAAHRSNLSVQMAGTACLYNLCREDRAQVFHPSVIRDIVDCCITATEHVPITLQLHKNVWLTLCNDYILQSGAFDMFRCCLAALESMVKCDDAQVTRITVAIVSILAAKIPTELTTRLGANRTYMKYLLRVVNQKIESRMAWLVAHGLTPPGQDQQQQQQLPPHVHQVQAPPPIQDVDMIDGNNNVPQQQNVQPAPPVTPPADLTLKFTLSALWNLTDESPATCSVFLEESGLKSVLLVLKAFQDSSIEAKVLGLLNNVAEVEHLKRRLINNDCLTAIQKLLLSTKIDVSYFAAGILAHLCADLTWDDCEPTWDDCLELLISTIRSWEKPRSEMVAYRSFKPFFHLLSKWTLPAVQYWALWAIHHVCSNNKERYVPLMIKEGGKTELER